MIEEFNGLSFLMFEEFDGSFLYKSVSYRKGLRVVKLFIKLPMIFSMPTFSVNLGILGSQIIWQKSRKKRWQVTNQMNHSS